MSEFIFKDGSNEYLVRYIGSEEEVTVPEGVTVIGEAAFASSFYLKKVHFPSSLKEIKKLAFYNCINLETELPACKVDADSFLGCPEVKIERFVLKEIAVEEIAQGSVNAFYVKDYQRGYRWTKNEVEELLNDINQATTRYCMQPLVVRKCRLNPDKSTLILSKNGPKEVKENLPSTAYELVDGQQRLTTLWLILSACADEGPCYTIYYELLRSIDKHYIEKAIETINVWIKNNLGVDASKKEAFAEKIRTNLFFIWYEMKTDGGIAAEEEFRNINDGQTPLTNAELFKALLLNPENALVYPDGHREDIQKKLYEMAFQWDQLEQSLRNDDFWFFIANDPCEERTHLDYLFELYAKTAIKTRFENAKKSSEKVNPFKEQYGKLDADRDRYSFLAIKTYVEYLDTQNGNHRFASVEQVWKEIVQQYHRLYSWFSDNELYHGIGYLIATEKKNGGNSIVPGIVAELLRADNLSIPDIKQKVRGKIKVIIEKQIFNSKGKKNEPDHKAIDDDSGIFSEQYYENRPKKEIRDFLLYINTYSTFEADSRFPFAKFKNTKDPQTGRLITWDIEHVSARNLKESISSEDLKKIQPWWDQEDKNNDGTEEAWKNFAKRVNEQEPDNSLSNLVLLDSSINRSYGDALFFGKRKEIIERDKKNAYIPICTKNAFLKYYTDEPDISSAWTKEDKIGYMKHILYCISKLYDNDMPRELKTSMEEQRNK